MVREQIEPGTRLAHKRTGQTVIVKQVNVQSVDLAGGEFLSLREVAADWNIQSRSGLSAYTTAEMVLLFTMSAGLARFNVHMASVAAQRGDKPATIARLKDALVHTEEAQIFSGNVSPAMIVAELERPVTMRELDIALKFIA